MSDLRQEKGVKMIAVRKQRVTLYVDRSSQQWVVLDPDGNFWILPSVDKPLGTNASRFTRPKRPSLSPFLGITNTCSVCPFSESKV